MMAELNTVYMACNLTSGRGLCDGQLEKLDISLTQHPKRYKKDLLKMKVNSKENSKS